MIDFIQKLLIAKYYEVIKTNFELEDEKVKVSITGLPSSGIKFSIPEGKVHSAIIENIKGCKRSCDYLVLVACRNFIDAYFIELKETLYLCEDGIPGEACRQILRTIPILDYLISMVKVIFKKELKVRKYFVVIGNRTRGIDKLQTDYKLSIYDRSYEGEVFRIIHSLDEIPFEKLRCQNP